MKPGLLRFILSLLGAIAPGLAARAAVTAFCTPRKSPAAKWERIGIVLGKASQLRVDGESLDATVWGYGPTVLLVHGWEGRRGQFARIALALAEAGFRVVAFDGPAHGASARTRTTLPEFSRAVERAAAQFGPLHAIVGHSYGAAAAAVAMRRGMRVERAVLIACPFSLRHVVRRYATRVGLSARSRKKMYPLMERLHRCPAEQLSFEAIGPDLAAPCLLIHDEADPAVPFADGERVARAIDGAELMRTQGLGHVRILRDEDVVRRVVQYVRRPL